MEKIDVRTERGMMEYSEEAIYDIQLILRNKVGESIAVIKKAMDIEDYLYRESLHKTGHEMTDNVWEHNDAVNNYMTSIENIKKLLKAKEGDWTKLFQIGDIRQFYLQLTTNRTGPKKKVIFLLFNLLILIN